MIKVTASNYVKADCVEEFLAVNKELVEKTNALDQGCKKYELCGDINDPLHFIMLEEWESQELLDGHMASRHFTELVPKMDSLTEKPAVLTLLKKVY